jgi:required for meiotic nuclear division protein 1
MALAQRVAANVETLVAARTHQFFAIAFEENLSLRAVASSFPQAKLSALDLYVPLPPDGGVYVYPFGAVVMVDVPAELRDEQLRQLHEARPNLTTQVLREDYSVVEDPDAKIGIVNGVLYVDRLTPGRSAIVALTVAQSAAMEYYERIVEQLSSETSSIVERLELKGSVPLRTRQMHRFIGQAVSTRTEVLSVLHLLDRPDAVWDDPAMDHIYNELRSEFDLGDRYESLEMKLRGTQEALELVLDVARDRRLVLLEVAVALLIVLEILVSFVKLT